MAWYPLPQSGGGSSQPAGDDFFDNHTSGWSLWSFSSPDDDQDTAAGASCSGEHGKGAVRPGKEADSPKPLELQCTQDILLSQFSDAAAATRSVDDAPPAGAVPLDMLPDAAAMRRLLSYESMLSAVLAGCPEDQDDRDTMDRDSKNNSSGIMVADPAPEDKAGTGMVVVKRSRSSTDAAPGLEALVLEELEDVVFQLAKKTRICFRDAFYRLAESSRARCGGGGGADDETSQAGSGSRSTFQLPEGDAASSRACPERETNAIDRTVADLTMKPPCSAPSHQRCISGNSAADISHITRV